MTAICLHKMSFSVWSAVTRGHWLAFVLMTPLFFISQGMISALSWQPQLRMLVEFHFKDPFKTTFFGEVYHIPNLSAKAFVEDFNLLVMVVPLATLGDEQASWGIPVLITWNIHIVCRYQIFFLTLFHALSFHWYPGQQVPLSTLPSSLITFNQMIHLLLLTILMHEWLSPASQIILFCIHCHPGNPKGQWQVVSAVSKPFSWNQMINSIRPYELLEIAASFNEFCFHPSVCPSVHPLMPSYTIFLEGHISSLVARLWGDSGMNVKCSKPG